MRLEGTWEKLKARLREQVRSQSGPEATPSAGVMDNPSAKTTRGTRWLQWGKKVKGRKRHLLKVHEAGLHDQEGGKLLLAPLTNQLPRIAKVWVDSAYRGLATWLKDTLGWELEIVKHWWSGGVWLLKGQEPPACPAGFQVLPRRWVVQHVPLGG
jgi:hypothetical protein